MAREDWPGQRNGTKKKPVSLRRDQSDLVEFAANPICRYLDPACPGLRNPQELHLHPCATDGRRDPQGGQSPAALGLGHWQAQAQKLLSSCFYSIAKIPRSVGWGQCTLAISI